MWRALIVLCCCAAPATIVREPRVPSGAVARLGESKFTHGAAVDRLAFCGDVVIATDRGGFVRAWDAATGEGRGTWSFTPVEDRFVRASCDSVVRASGERIALATRAVETLHGDVLDTVGTTIVHADRVERAGKPIATFGDAAMGRLSPNGRSLALFTPGEAVVIYADVARASSRILPAPAPEAIGFAWSDDGKRLLVTRYASAVEVYTKFGELERRFEIAHELGAVTAIAASAHVIAIGTGAGLVIRYDATTGTRSETLRATSGEITALAFSADGTRLALGTYQGVHVIATTAKGIEFEGRRGSPVDAAFSLDGTRVATAGGDGVLRIWDATTGKQLSELAAMVPADRVPLASVAWALGGVVAVDASGIVRRWDDHTWNRIEIPMASKLTAFASSLDHSLLGTAAPEGWWLYDASRLAPRSHGAIAPAASDGGVTSFALDTTGSRFAYCIHGPEPAAVEVVARDGTRVTHLTLVGTACPALALSPDGAQLALGTGILVSLADTRVHTAFSHGDHDLLAFSPDGKVIVAAHGSELEMIDLATHSTHGLAGHTGTIHSITWSAAGDRFVTTSGDLTAIVWRR